MQCGSKITFAQDVKNKAYFLPLSDFVIFIIILHMPLRKLRLNAWAPNEIAYLVFLERKQYFTVSYCAT